ncbi:MAG TPA: carboxymuconolactone decarboxylase family protein [Longimicrobium sp.]|nr:carboxymuconolactone decarboxylase family protein [Longimicrobium sp.]
MRALKPGRTTCVAFAALALAGAAPARAQDAGDLVITREATRPSRVAPAQNFTGTVRVRPLFDTTAATRAYAATVAFEAGARSAWHTHPRGQVLIVTEGVGRVQRWGASAEEIRTGDVVRIPPGVKHWHGAAPTTAMSHIAVVETLDGRSTDWMEKVSDAQYGAPVRARGADAGDSARPSRARQLMGDIAPKLAQLTDDVLFGQVWASPELSQRDRSLVTISALVALNRPDQLRSHLDRARTNGLTQAEVIAAITQLAFYSGWPNAVTAIPIAREVFREP